MFLCNDPTCVSPYIIQSEESIASDYEAVGSSASDAVLPTSLEASQCVCGAVSGTAPHPAGRRSDATPLDTITDKCHASTSTASSRSLPNSRTKRYAKLSRAPDGPETVKLPECDDWKGRRDYVVEMRRHLKRRGLVSERALTCGAGLYAAEVINHIDIYQSPDDELVLERRMRSEGIRRCERKKQCSYCALHDDMVLVRNIWESVMGCIKSGGALYFLTLTVPHRSSDPMHALADLIHEAWKSLNKARAAFLREKGFGCSWWIRVLETTFGNSGAHPHFHVILAFNRPLEGTRVDGRGGEPDKISERLLGQAQGLLHHSEWDMSEVAVFCLGLLKQWKLQVERLAPKILGRSVEVSLEAQDFRSVGVVGLEETERRTAERLAMYLSKAGIGAALELGYVRGKKGRRGSRSVIELLHDICEEAQPGDISLWLEYRYMIERHRTYATSIASRNPFKMYADVEMLSMPVRDGMWLKVGEEEPFFVPGWLYLILFRQELWLTFTHHAERLGSAAMIQALTPIWDWYDSGPPDENRELRVAVKLMCCLVRLDDVPPEFHSE